MEVNDSVLRATASRVGTLIRPGNYDTAARLE